MAGRGSPAGPRARRRRARAQLPEPGDPGRRRPRRRLAGAVAHRGPHRRDAPSCSAACTSWPRPPRSSARTRRCSSRPRTRGARSPTPSTPSSCGLEGRAPGRGGRGLRQHLGRGEGRVRHLLHLLQRRRGRRVHPARAGGALPARPVPRRARPPADRPRQPCRSGSASATCTPASAHRRPHPGRGPPRRRTARAPRVRLRELRDLAGRRGRPADGPDADPVHRRDGRPPPAP